MTSKSRAVAFDPTDGSLLTAGSDGIVRRWAADRELRPPIRHGSSLTSLAIGPDGIVFALDLDYGRVVSSSGTEVLGQTRALAAHPRRPELVVSRPSNEAELVDARTGKAFGKPLIHRRESRLSPIVPMAPWC